MHTNNQKVLDAVTVDVANTDAPIIDVSLAQYKSIQFIAADVSGGSGAFGIEVSNDGVNWIVYNRLVSNVTNTNVQTDTRVAAPTLSSSTSSIYFFPSDDHFRYMRVFVDVTTDGTYSAILQTAE